MDWTAAFAGVQACTCVNLSSPPRRLSSPLPPPRSSPLPPSSSSSSPSTSSRRTCSTNIGRSSPAGFARLASGTVFRNGYQSHAMTETCPGHSTILTGDHPARTGIVEQLLDRPVDRPLGQERLLRRGRDACRAPARSRYKVSPKHLLVPTLGELMKARWPGSRSVAVAGKDRAAVMMTRARRRPALVLERQDIRHRSAGLGRAGDRAQG